MDKRKYDGFVIRRKGKRVVVPAYEDHGVLPSELLTIDEIVDDLYHGLADNTLDDIKNEKYENMIMYHHTFGQWIRNTFGLWIDGNPNVVPGDLGNGHPDGVSMIVMQNLHKCLTNPELVQTQPKISTPHWYDSVMDMFRR